MKLVIAEKPDMARKIAAIIGATQNKREWLEGNGYLVTWVYGHLLEISVPEAAGKWTLENLPILPSRFDLTPIKIEQREGQRPRLEVIRELMERCTSMVEATDAGREGELIFRNLYEYMGIRKPFERLWVNSLTDEAIAEGFENLHPSSEFDGLFRAARQRERADWVVGINATRAFTLALAADGVMSLGRVQTPTLCIICDRFVENQRFQPELFWFLRGASMKGGIEVPWRGTGRYDKDQRREAEADYEKVKRNGFVTVDDVKTERKTEEPPLLHDLSSLQKIANAKYGYKMDETLAIAQTLYEKQLITYPRTGCRYIPEDVFRTISSTLRRLQGNAKYGDFIRDLIGAKLSRRSVNDTKITDHHALLPTGRKADGLDDREENVYDLILTRMLESFSAPCIADITVVKLSSEDVEFETRGRKDVSLGWRAITRMGDYEEVRPEDVDEVEISMRPLPELTVGERLAIAKIDLVEDTTKPKPLLTDATLASAMEFAGRFSDDKELASALKGVGIGTVATRAEIKNKLLARRYIMYKGEDEPGKKKKGKQLIPTKLGLNVYSAIRDRKIASVEMTAEWEIKLKELEEGNLDEASFEREIRGYTGEIVKNLLKGERLARVREALQADKLKCPRCGEEIRLYDKSAWCKKCNYTLWRTIAGKRLSDDTMKKLLKDKQTGLLSGFTSKKGTTFDAYVVLDSEGAAHFEFPQKKGDKKK